MTLQSSILGSYLGYSISALFITSLKEDEDKVRLVRNATAAATGLGVILLSWYFGTAMLFVFGIVLFIV